MANNAQQGLFSETDFQTEPQAQVETVWIKARIKGRPLKVGRVCAGPQMSVESELAMTLAMLITGRPIFYREQTTWYDFYSYQDKSIGCDRAAWNEALRRGVLYMVTYAKKERRIVVVHASNVNYDLNLGRGIQARAKIKYCHVFENVEGLSVPATKKSVVVEGIEG
jgi:hypothetical protein